jgi:hypothetical protein
MPREVKAYACEFRCGKKTTMRRASMVEHEAKCWRNPAAKACLTCRYERMDDECDEIMTGPDSWWETWYKLRFCGHEPPLIAEHSWVPAGDADDDNPGVDQNGRPMCRVECPGWQAK